MRAIIERQPWVSGTSANPANTAPHKIRVNLTQKPAALPKYPTNLHSPPPEPHDNACGGPHAATLSGPAKANIIRRRLPTLELSAVKDNMAECRFAAALA